MHYIPDLLQKKPFVFPEAPRWFRDAFYFCDIDAGTLYRIGADGTAQSIYVHGSPVSGWVRLDDGSLIEAYHANLRSVLAHARSLGMQVVPGTADFGYSESILWHDPNLAEGLPVRDATFRVSGGALEPFEDPAARIANGDFERLPASGDAFPDWAWQDAPGAATFVDTSVRHGGQASLRMTDIGLADPEHGHGRIMQRIAVRPFRYYHASVWVRTREWAGGDVRLLVLGQAPGRTLQWNEVPVAADQDWARFDVTFNTLTHSEVLLYLGVWGGRTGSLWWDDAVLEPAGFVNVIRRTGAPVRLRRVGDASEVHEGRDVAAVADPRMGRAPWPGSYDLWHEPPRVVVPEGSSLSDGDVVVADYYHMATIYSDQVTASLTEPAVLAVVEGQLDSLQREFGSAKAFSGWFLGYDEIRVHGWDEAPVEGNTPGQHLAAQLSALHGSIRRRAPEVDLFIWSDMFDPFHNAGDTQDPYYLVNGNWDGACLKTVMAIGVFFLLSASRILGVLLINIMMFVIIYFFSGCYRRAGVVIAVAVAAWVGLQFQAYASANETAPFMQYLASFTYDAAPWIAWGIVVVLGAVVFLVRQLASGNRVQVQRYIAMVILFLANACFWALFEQAGSSMNFFAREFVTPVYGSMETWQAGGFDMGGVIQGSGPRDPDGFEDIEEVYLISDSEELFWRLDSQSWRRSGDGEESWIGANGLRLPDGRPFPAGEYRLLLRVIGEEGLLHEKKLTFFCLAGQYAITGINSYPPTIMPGREGRIAASFLHPEGTDPYVRWSGDGAVLASGRLSEGLAELAWTAPRSEGVYTVQVELFPVPPAAGADFPTISPITANARLFVSSKPAAGIDELRPASSYFALFHFNGSLRDEVAGLLSRVDHLYLTVCLDVFPAAVAPGVSAPAALGVDPALVERLVDVAVGSGKLRVADVAELNPKFDIDSRSARLGARLLARIAEGVVQRRS